MIKMHIVYHDSVVANITILYFLVCTFLLTRFNCSPSKGKNSLSKMVCLVVALNVFFFSLFRVLYAYHLTSR